MMEQSPAIKRLLTEAYEKVLWQEIFKASRTDPALTELLERAKLYYLLKRDHEQTGH